VSGDQFRCRLVGACVDYLRNGVLGHWLLPRGYLLSRRVLTGLLREDNQGKNRMQRSGLPHERNPGRTVVNRNQRNDVKDIRPLVRGQPAGECGFARLPHRIERTTRSGMGKQIRGVAAAHEPAHETYSDDANSPPPTWSAHAPGPKSRVSARPRRERPAGSRSHFREPDEPRRRWRGVRRWGRRSWLSTNLTTC
jgi:hypothetical protein